MNHIIETRGLVKRYGDTTAVDSLDLVIRRGEVYGFLGPNGAGKTTTLRMLLGLIQPDSGEISVLGGEAGTAESLGRIGAMIETPAFYPHLSGWQNLLLLAKYADVDQSRIAPVLEQVRLADRADDPFRAYSLGMKQRLGVAAALLKDPDLLILDEPTNGLDPAGMAEMRELVRELGSGERTVLLSSHLMTEVEHICDRAGIISRGKLVAEGTVDELRGEDTLVIRADPIDGAARILAGITPGRALTITNGGIRVTCRDGDTIDPACLNERLVAEGIAVRELRHDRPSLESVFLSLTSRTPADNESPTGIAHTAPEVAHVH